MEIVKEVSMKLKFVAEAEANMGKSEKDLNLEKVVEFVEDATNECELAISTIESSIKDINNKLTRANKALNKAEIARDKAYFTTNRDFAAYVSALNNAEDTIESAQDVVNGLVWDLNEKTEDLAKFNLILSKLTATI
jgi:predicted  nucleic acid-binding Zn-ribbon protein